jgi:hypothetical protein
MATAWNSQSMLSKPLEGLIYMQEKVTSIKVVSDFSLFFRKTFVIVHTTAIHGELYEFKKAFKTILKKEVFLCVLNKFFSIVC